MVKLRLYLDACCLNRPFDDQLQERVHLESEAILLIIKRLQTKQWLWLSSSVLRAEIKQTSDEEHRNRVLSLLAYSDETLRLNQDSRGRAKMLKTLGFGTADALHLACAEEAKVDVFLSTDDKLVKRAKRLSQDIKVKVENPLIWLKEFIDDDDFE